MVIELKRGESGDVVLNNLYKQTQMQSVFGINMVALLDGQPRLLNLKEVLEAFLRNRREIVTRRTIFEAVSYTHLDVYKRQLPACAESG